MSIFNKFKMISSLTAIIIISGCGGYGNGMYGNTNSNGQGSGGGNAMGSGNYGGLFGNAGSNVLGSVVSSAMGGGIGGTVLSSIIQGMGSNVLNGQIGSQLSPTDQNFRLQQLGGAVHSGTVKQAQQWTNPQTGNTIALNPVGQQTLHSTTQQTCQNLQETVTQPNGQNITENRLACLNAQTGKWNLVH